MSKMLEYLGDGTYRKTFVKELPCGHRLQISMSKAGANFGSETQYVADLWFETRTARHDCTLVCDENPMGLKNLKARNLPKE